MKTSLSTTTKLAALMILATLFASTLVALSLQAGDDRDTFVRPEGKNQKYTHTFQVTPGGTLRLDTDLGDVTIRKGGTGTVDVVVDVRGDRDDIEDFDVKFSEGDGTVEVIGRYRHSGWHFGWDGLDVKYEVTVPGEFDTRIETSGGDVSISGLKGLIRAGTSGGDVTVSDHEGDTQVSTSGGDIHVSNLLGALKSETSGGNIRGTRIAGEIYVETSGGDITLKEISGKTTASTSGGSVRLGMLDNQGVDASTSGGDIVIELPGDTPADIHAETSMGDVRCDFSIRGRLDDGNLEGEINGGGKRIRAETSGGDIAIRVAR